MHLVMFDIDGTLTQTDDIDEDCYARAVSDVLGVSAINRDWSQYHHVTDSGIANEVIEANFGRSPLAGEVDRVQARFAELLHESLRANESLFVAIAGAPQLIAQLSKIDDVAIAIATGGWRVSAELKLRAAGINTLRIPLATADDSPERAVIMATAYQRACELHQTVQFESFIYVGDGVWDLAASQALGIPFIGVASGARADTLQARGAAHLVPDFADLDKFVELMRWLQS